MSKVAVFMADGCEEIEGLTVVDILRRAGIKIDMLSIGDNLNVTGAHGIQFRADYLMTDKNSDDYDGVILPGGMPGTTSLENNTLVQSALRKQFSAGKLIAAICAAPSILGKNGMANGKKVTSYPGFEEAFSKATYVTDSVVTDGNVITSRGMGTAIDFALAILKYLKGKEAADEMAKKIIYNQ
ncbi:MAG: DJ-1/PfpI family protein [Lachnospiraceae bacterium]|nr:DJ-1/PfpI family protein [Lachnospiraceae bacterium]